MMQSLEMNLYEVLVIDNNSTDDTRQVVQTFQDQYPNIFYQLETAVGLSHARNTGVRVARSSFVAFTDDDCRLQKDWLLFASRHIEEKRGKVFGGAVYPFYLNGKPGWYEDRYAEKIFGDVSKSLEAEEYLIGCNFFVDKSIFPSVGFFDPDLGMNGNTIGYGEETEWQMRVKKKYGDHAVFYDPALFVWHLERPEQLTIKWLTRSFLNKGRDNFRMSVRKNPQVKRNFVGWISKILQSYAAIGFHFLFGYFVRNQKKYRYPQNYHYEKLQGHWKRIGYLQEALKYKNAGS